MIDQLLSTPEQFFRWLLEQPPDQPIGERNRVDACPIRNFLNDRLGGSIPYLSVSRLGIHTCENEEYFTSDYRAEQLAETPNWAARFIGHVDVPRPESGEYCKDIYRQEALFAIANIYSNENDEWEVAIDQLQSSQTEEIIHSDFHLAHV